MYYSKCATDNLTMLINWFLNNPQFEVWPLCFIYVCFIIFFLVVQKTGIMEMREALQEKEDAKNMKAKMREKV